MDFWGCEGSGATFHGLRMRSRSTRKCAHRNAGDLGSNLTVCACAYDPIHVTAQGKSLGPNCACVQSPRHYRGLPMNACVLYPMGSREFSCPNMGIVTSNESPDLNARFWLVEKIFAALWLVSTQRGHFHYFLCLFIHNIGSKQERESLRSLRSYFEFYLKICFTDYSSYIKRWFL